MKLIETSCGCLMYCLCCHVRAGALPVRPGLSELALHHLLSRSPCAGPILHPSVRHQDPRMRRHRQRRAAAAEAAAVQGDPLCTQRCADPERVCTHHHAADDQPYAAGAVGS